MHWGVFTRTSIFGLLILVSLSKAVLSYSPDDGPGDYYRTCPLPRCERCPSNGELRAPGVGFALETSHGAAVVRLHDGSLHHIALIQGDASYTALLRRLATGPVPRTPDHFDTNWEKWQYAKARAQRLMNKLVGRPATPETATLAAMVLALRTATQTWLGPKQPVAAAVLSSPDHIRLTDEETNDVFDYLKLRNLMAEPDSFEKLFATSAAYAGYGRGLCTNYTDAYACEREEWYFPEKLVLHIDFNRESLSGTIKYLQSARDMHPRSTFIDPDLGYAREEMRLAFGRDGDDAMYWATISARIRELAVASRHRVTEILLTGTSATHPRLKAALEDALRDLVSEGVLAALDDYGDKDAAGDELKSLFEFATGRGAAELAKRRQEGPVRCTQTDECRQRRERQRPALLQMQGPAVLQMQGSDGRIGL